MKFSVVHKGAIYLVEILQQENGNVTIDEDSTSLIQMKSEHCIIDLKKILQMKTGIAIEDQRLIHRGKTLNDNVILENSSIKNSNKVMLIGTTFSDKSTMKDAEEQAKNEQHLRNTRHVVNITERNASLQGRQSSKYRFEGIKVLEDLPNSEKAKDILNLLAHDPGIQKVLDKHKWSVGCLSEMYPSGKVGVDPVCVLGLNRNKGKEILLRLRTDDLLGFRKLLKIKQVLYHELAHNVYSEHDQDFYKLFRQIEREAGQFDWSNKPGNYLGGSATIVAEADLHKSTTMFNFSGTVGGHSEPISPLTPSELQYQAAQSRLQSQIKAEDKCTRRQNLEEEKND